MIKSYIDTVRLLLRVTPDVFSGELFAMKGGTAINLFVRDMPRLSVDIDVVSPCPLLHRITQEDHSIVICADKSPLRAAQIGD